MKRSLVKIFVIIVFTIFIISFVVGYYVTWWIPSTMPTQPDPVRGYVIPITNHGGTVYVTPLLNALWVIPHYITFSIPIIFIVVLPIIAKVKTFFLNYFKNKNE